jgi:alkylation response protein AidB-like acyl-CoA dehydrogenase
MATASAAVQASAKELRQPKQLPAPNGDFYEVTELLNPEELATLDQLRVFLKEKVAPVINKYWVEDAFPFELLPEFPKLNIGGVGLEGYGCRGGSPLLNGFVAMEMARVDASIATLAQLDTEGKLQDHHASLAKAFTTARMRETVAWGREVFGANGIIVDYNAARFFADAEALYSYEGTYQMQNLIVGKAVTGLSAVV